MTKSKPISMHACGPGGGSKGCSWLMAAIIIVLTWWMPARLWSQVVITIAAIIVFAGDCCQSKK